MKLENDPTFGTQTSPRKSYNPFDSDDEHTDDFIKSYADTYDLKRFDKNVDPLALHLDDNNMSWEEAILCQSSKSAPVMNDEEVLLSKDAELFTDKTVINGGEENIYHTVKDIGVDEGLPKDNRGSEDISSIQFLNGETDGDVDIKNQVSPFIAELEFKSKSNVETDLLMKGKHSFNPFEAEYLTKIDKLKHDSIKKESDLKRQGAGDATRDRNQSSETGEVNYVKVAEKGGGDSKKECSVDDVPLEHVKESSTKPSIMNTTDAVMKSCETQKEEATTLELSKHPATSSGDVTDKLSYNSKVESGNIVLDVNSSTTSGKEGKEEKADLQNDSNVKPPKPQTILRHEDGPIGMDKCVHGETCFSSVMPPPASVTLMAHCGSTSLRSESSMGSTRSFAFPVLQAEWNSSPVRMAKPDPRHGQKYRGWVQSLICCKF